MNFVKYLRVKEKKFGSNFFSPVSYFFTLFELSPLSRKFHKVWVYKNKNLSLQWSLHLFTNQFTDFYFLICVKKTDYFKVQD